MTIPTVSYFEKPTPKEKVIKDVKIVIKDGSKPEVYTEEHEKMLGDHKEPWIVGVDGYDDEGNRMYDAHDGKSCHQCRQNTLATSQYDNINDDGKQLDDKDDVTKGEDGKHVPVEKSIKPHDRKKKSKGDDDDADSDYKSDSQDDDDDNDDEDQSSEED